MDPKHLRPAVPGELRWYATVPGGVEVERPNGTSFVVGKETITPKSRTFIPARVTDNPTLMATGYVAQLQALPEPLRSQLLYGDMAAGLEDDPWQCIPTAWVQAAQSRWTPTPPEGQPLSALGVDPARGGRDKTAISPRHGHWFAQILKYPGSSTPDGPSVATLVMAAHADPDAQINVDAIGIGSAVIDSLKEHRGFTRVLHAINAAESTDYRDRSGKFRLVNIRAAMYWRLREALDPEDGDSLALPPDPELLADLCAPRYKLTASGIAVEPKDDVISRIGRSPDAGDATVMAAWIAPRRTLKIY